MHTAQLSHLFFYPLHAYLTIQSLYKPDLFHYNNLVINVYDFSFSFSTSLFSGKSPVLSGQLHRGFSFYRIASCIIKILHI